ncbi:T9SS type A sorting domain-containing protein [Winogradskyella bathintestinalis]|uniref:T9SS type A sorting domain-containing protein n=1 Tax=Winogradskyella bathintestinalis TaxID=3035208 RepID=A0ABT7ZUS6_9FLAO|nr:T9SS type A sorting domain-containing protein [Winogradskyella bathintestinalis]MDN3492727.1 T9SS type A sorting domain-containing protein [Winogradskyella bathintestinalis]
MKKTFFLISLSLVSLSLISAQEVTISSGAKIQVNGTASLNVDGLTITPSSSYELTENTLTKSATAIVVGSNESMDRVYSFTNPVTNFQGSIVFNYDDADENGIADDDAVLELNQDGSWTNYPDTDGTDNMITSVIDNAINFSQVTASSASATLTVESISDTELFKVYPNPVVNEINIEHKNAVEVTITNQLGQQVLKTNQKTIDFSSFAKGLYILQITNTNKTNTNNFKIIKQ